MYVDVYVSNVWPLRSILNKTGISHTLSEPTSTQFKAQCTKLYRTPDIFRCEFAPSSGEQVEDYA